MSKVVDFSHCNKITLKYRHHFRYQKLMFEELIRQKYWNLTKTLTDGIKHTVNITQC